MAKNRFAQPLYGKIIYIYETDLKKEELATIFDPSTYWIDVTGLDCEVGYILEYVEGGGLRFVPPPNEEYTFEEEQARMLEKVDVWTESKITGGFISECTGNPVRYDSDKDTQLTMQGIALNVSTERFANEYPLGCPVRGYKEGETEKTIQYINAAQVYTWCADLSSHIGACKQQGWIKQAQVEAALSKEDLDAIILD
jgi:hypothetical protein